MEPRFPAPLPLAESRRTAADLIRQTLGASKAPGRSVRVGSLLPPLRQVTRVAPQRPLQLLGRQAAPEPSPRVLFGSRDERSPEALVQAGESRLIGSGNVRLWITHDDEGSA